MGCLQSRQANSAGNNKNGVNGDASKVPCMPGSQSAPPATDLNELTPLTNYDEIGLNARQVFSLKQSWKGIKRKMEETGVEMFVGLFKTNSELQTLFQGFKHIHSDDELRSNEALEYHASLVMSTLDDAITHIDNYEFVKQLLTRTGASHIKFPGFKPENFMQMKGPFLDAVRVTLGDRYTDNMENIYTIAITFILETLMDGIKGAWAAAGVNTTPSETSLT